VITVSTIGIPKKTKQSLILGISVPTIGVQTKTKQSFLGNISIGLLKRILSGT
jgi:hypothetical protein